MLVHSPFKLYNCSDEWYLIQSDRQLDRVNLETKSVHDGQVALVGVIASIQFGRGRPQHAALEDRVGAEPTKVWWKQRRVYYNQEIL